MRRKVLAHSVRTLVEQLESRTLLSVTLSSAHSLPVNTDNVVVAGMGTNSIFGTVYQDLNANGQHDPGEPVVVSGTVFIDVNDNGILDSNDISTTTDDNGGFGFTNLADGTYNIRIVPDPGFKQPGGPSTVQVSGGIEQVVIIGEISLTAVQSNATVSGTVFDDVNQDGIYDPINEVFLSFDTVYVDLNQNGVFDTNEPSVASSSVGAYSFTLPAGTYELRVIPRPGFHQDPPGYFQITLAGGDTDIANLGENDTTTLTGDVFQDLNGNGVLDPGEPIVAGETVWLDTNFDDMNIPGTFDPTTGGFDDGNPNVISDFTGLYTFSDLTPGTYRVRIDSSRGKSGFVEDNPGFIDVTVTQQQVITLNVPEGAPSTVSGTVFNDLNGNGVQDPGEPVISGQTVFIDWNSNGVFDEAGNALDGEPFGTPEPSFTTGMTGAFSLGQLGPGSYTLRFQFPEQATPTAPANPANDLTFVLTPGETLAGQNFGYKTADLSAELLQFPTHAAFSGQSGQAVVRLANVGNQVSVGDVNINLYASSTTTIDPTVDTLIGTTPPPPIAGIPLTLAPGQSKVFRFTYTLPVQMTTGTYYIAADVVSTTFNVNTSNDISNIVGPVTITLPFIDIGLAYADGPPATADPGKAIVIDLLLSNSGNVTNAGVLTFRFYTELTSTFDPTNVPAERITLKGIRIKPGHSRVVHLVLSSPGASLAARYIFTIVDAGDALGETNLANNVAAEVTPTVFL